LFAAELLYGQVKKHYRVDALVRVTQVLRCGTGAGLKAALTGLGLSRRLNTAFVERVNVRLRQRVAAVARRTWSTLQDAPQLLLQLECWRAHKVIVRAPVSLRVRLAQPRDRAGRR